MSVLTTKTVRFIKHLAEPCFDQGTFGLWAQHASHCATLLTTSKPINAAIGRKKFAKIFVGELGWSRIGWAFEKESIPQVSSHLESFCMTYDANQIGAIWGNRIKQGVWVNNLAEPSFDLGTFELWAQHASHCATLLVHVWEKNSVAILLEKKTWAKNFDGGISYRKQMSKSSAAILCGMHPTPFELGN